jgi:protein dithiol oxidoreductase (disulfide-forming)
MMTMKKLLAAIMLFFSVNLMAEPMMGADFNQTAQNIATDNPTKIEVAELFWYGCPHCHTLDPHLAAWVKKLPQDVYFKRVPGLPRPDWAPMAKAYYTIETLGVLEKLHVKLFEAVHTKRALKPDDEPAIIDWITKESGMDRKKVNEAFNSFSNNTKLNRAAQFFRASGATGVPSLVIDGKYITSSTMAGGNLQALKVADYLISKARAEKTSK